MIKSTPTTMILVGVMLLPGCTGDENILSEKKDEIPAFPRSIYEKAPTLQTRIKKIISVNGFQFKDLNSKGSLANLSRIL